MKKVLSVVLSYFFMTTTLWALTFTCIKSGDTNCKISDQDAITTITTCNAIKKIDKNSVFRYPKKLLQNDPSCKEWSDYEDSAKKCPYVVHVNVPSTSNDSYDIVAFCITNPDVLVVYTDDDTANWSFEQKKCVGSGGTWSNNSCNCDALPGTKPVNNECLCTANEKQKYFNKIYSGCETLKDGVKSARDDTRIYGFGDYDLANIDKANSCSPSGGTWSGPEKNECICNNKLNLKLDSTKYFCNCADNTDYIDPLRKHNGCASLENITISGTVVDGITQDPLSSVQVFVASNNQLTTTTGDDGKYTLENIPNNADISFNLSGYNQQTVNATNLNNKTISLIPSETDEESAESESLTEQYNDNATDAKGDENTDIDNATDASGDDDNETQNENENPEISDKLKSAQDALAAAREKENSWANRGITAASSAMTGLGGMQLAEGIAERRADAEAEKEMRAYIETMKCEYGNGQNVKLGNEEITLPGGNELLDYYTEYKQLADNLKTTKSALGLRSGIESEVLYDRAQSGLYQYASIGKTGGAETSLYRALTDKESEDAVAWAEQKEKSAKQLKTGALVAGAGVAIGIIGNYLVNERGNKTEELKREFQQVEKETELEFPLFILTISDTKGSTQQNREKLATIDAKPITRVSGVKNNLGTELSKLNFVTDNATFESGEYTLKNSAALDEWARKISNILLQDEYKDSKICITAEGNTDRTTPAKKPGRDYTTNEQLSQKRADAVINHLKERSPLKSFISQTYSYGYGAKNCTEPEHTKNDPDCRYVSVTVTDCTTELSKKMAPVMGTIIDKIDFNQLLQNSNSQQ